MFNIPVDSVVRLPPWLICSFSSPSELSDPEGLGRSGYVMLWYILRRTSRSLVV